MTISSAGHRNFGHTCKSFCLRSTPSFKRALTLATKRTRGHCRMKSLDIALHIMYAVPGRNS